MATKKLTPADYRKAAEDKTIPQEVRNTFLDKAVEIEQRAYQNSKEIKDVNSHKWKGTQ
ncbi:MAG: hypothetical protein ACOVLB_05625 [Candidatus Nanopelagicus sp.]|jgi:hypothetical protein